ncbi:MAG TPA: hypothetical protein VMY76_02690 [Gemmatimonadales bacterium]|nr:hypothetical protein [Gemmatimonadales bacterium]
MVRAVASALALCWVAEAEGQSRPWLRLGATAIVAFEHADPVPGGGVLGEIRVVQPSLHLHGGALGRLRLTGMLNLEGATIPDGELAPGDWGEGFVDRRHPHTYLHEFILSADDVLGARDGGARLSLSAGKGFAPFGTDDPMVRPFVRYPVNHHLAQILERAVAIAAVRVGPIAGEVGLFNGDEPERPGQWPRLGGRFGDSWSGRLTGALGAGVTLQASHAHVHSPEHRPGAGTDQGKWSVAARWDRPVGSFPVYALLEWARTSEANGFFVFSSVLAEGAWTSGPHRLQYRFEQTERPEEQRVSRFRSLRPHLENSIFGISRWTTHTAGYALAALERSGLLVQPLFEVGYAKIAKVGGGIFDVGELYGRDHVWSLVVGVRVSGGDQMRRMGRYGAAEPERVMLMNDHEGMQ